MTISNLTFLYANSVLSLSVMFLLQCGFGSIYRPILEGIRTNC